MLGSKSNNLNLGSTITWLQYSYFHNLIQKIQFKPKTCIICLKQIKCGVYVLKCINCKLHCHPKCKDLLCKLCSGTGISIVTKQIGKKDKEFKYPTKSPFIPFPLICLINEIESRVHQEFGIYCTFSCSDKSNLIMNKIIGRFRKGKPQHLGKYNVQTLANSLLIILKDLEDGPLIRHWNIQRDEMNTKLMLDIESLPFPRRNTLIMLLYHFQTISKHEFQLNIKSLAKIFSPILIEREIYQQKYHDLNYLTTLEEKLLDLLQIDSKHLFHIINNNYKI